MTHNNIMTVCFTMEINNHNVTCLFLCKLLLKNISFAHVDNDYDAILGKSRKEREKAAEQASCPFCFFSLKPF